MHTLARWLTRGRDVATSCSRSRAAVTTLLVLLQILVIGAVFTGMAWYHGRATRAQAEAQALSLAHALASLTEPAVLRYDYASLEQATEGFAATTPDVRYAIVHLQDGTVAAHSGRDDLQGTRLEDAVSQAAFEAQAPQLQAVTLTGPEEAGYDAAVPIVVEGSAHVWGIVRVGFSLTRTHARLEEGRRQLMALSLTVLGGGAGLSVPLARRLVPTARRRPKIPLGAIVHSREEAVALARAYIGEEAKEWLLGLCLNATKQVVGRHVFYEGHRCPCAAAAAIEPFAAYARRVQAATVITIRYHPHPMPAMSAQRVAAFQRFRAQLRDRGLGRHEHLTADVRGEIFSWSPEAYGTALAEHQRPHHDWYVQAARRLRPHPPPG
jgi:Single cache domain 3